MVVVMLVDASGGVDNKTTEESKLDKAEGGVGWKQGNAESFHFIELEIKKTFSRGKRSQNQLGGGFKYFLFPAKKAVEV